MNRIFTCIFILMAIGTAHAQVPNYSFETWDSTGGYMTPIGWDNRNAQTYTTGTNTCERLSPGYTGSYFLALNTEDVPGMGTVPGVAVCGKLDPVSHLPVSGFAYSGRPQVMACKWQYMPFHTTDNGHVAVLLSKWNSAATRRDTIAFSSYTMTGMVMAWQQFQLGLNYTDTATPDSAMIYFTASSSSPVAYSFLWVDDVELRDSVPPTTGIKQMFGNSTTRLFPNPATIRTNLLFQSTISQQLAITICDVSGHTICNKTWNARPGSNQIPVETQSLTPGLYFVRVTDISETKLLKLLIE